MTDRSANRLRSIFAGSPDGMAVVRLEGLNLSRAYNPAFASMFGLPPSNEDVAMSRETHPTLTLLDLVDPIDRPKVCSLFERAKAGVRPQLVRVRFAYEDVRLIGDLSVFFPGNGVVLMFAIRDVTTEQRALEELQRAQERLAVAAGLTSLAKMTAGICHELNSPVGALRSAADVLMRTSDGKAAKLAQVVNDASHRITEITESLSRFANLDGAPVSTFDLCASIDDVLAVLNPIPAGVTIERNYAQRPQVTSKPGELNQVWLELLDNAVKATQEGTVAVSTSIEDGRALVRITDEGPGIAAEALPDLFQPTFTARAGRMGLGLGLPTAARIVSGCGGEISAAQKPDRGAVFEVRLPLS